MNIDEIKQFFLQQEELWGSNDLLLGIKVPQTQIDDAADMRRVQQIPVVESKEIHAASRLKLPPRQDKNQLLHDLRQRLKNYNANSVFGNGNANVNMVFLSDAVTYDHVYKDKVFIDTSETIFLRMLTKMGFTMQEIFVTPLFKFVDSKQDRDDRQLAQKIVQEQLKIIQPRYLILLGQAVAQIMLDSTSKLDDLRSRVHLFAGVKTIVTCHPSQLEGDKQLFWQVFDDMKLFRSLYDREIGGKPAMF